MILINLLLAEVVNWELLFPYQGFDPYARNPLTLHGDTLVLAGGRYEPLPGMKNWGFCTAVDTVTGAILWDREFLRYEKSVITALATGQGCFYVAGQCRSPFGYWDIFAAKLDFSGNLLWERTSEIPEGDGLVVSAMVDPRGNLVVVGIRWEHSEDIDITLVSWDPDGNQRWSAAYDSPWHMDDVGWSASMDEEGSSYVVGYYTGPVKREGWSVEPLIVRHDGNRGPEPFLGPPDTCYGLNPLVIKVDSSGNLVWVDDCEYLTNGGEFLFAEYRYGRLYVSGSVCPGDPYTECLDKYGQHLWHAYEYDYSAQLAQHNGCVDVNGNLYLAVGQCCNPGPDAFVISYSAYGQRRFISPVSPGGGRRVAVDPWGNLFVGGRVADSLGEDFMVTKLDTTGNLKWLYRKDDGTPDTNQPDECYGLLPDNLGGVFAMGLLHDSAMTPIHYIVHLADTTGGISEGPGGARGLLLAPAPSGFFISGYEGEAQVYDPAGRLVLSREIRGKTLISPLSPGVYFVVAGRQRAKVTVR